MNKKLEISRPIEGLILLTINGAGKNNVAGAALAQELCAACEEINLDTAVRVVIITGAEGKAFCTGLPGRVKDSIYSLSIPVAALECPVIAAINGDATGVGFELALACDIRIASASARFSLPYIEKGLIPSDGATQRLPRLIGRARAIELMLTGEAIWADEAYRIGLVSRVTADKKLMPAVLEMGKEMAAKAALSLKYCKEAALKGLDMTLDQGLRLEADLYFLLHTTEDRTEGITAFKEKRKPHFKGR
ncbi:MAG: enoyl-CoA hydratase-related protein [Chloroflexi bacterium]|nr:enoyl-CoA hydratase-related protein [Chloroflexota bacterium]